MDEIVTSFNQRTVGLLAMKVKEKYFHSHLVLLSSMKVYSSFTEFRVSFPVVIFQKRYNSICQKPEYFFIINKPGILFNKGNCY